MNAVKTLSCVKISHMLNVKTQKEVTSVYVSRATQRHSMAPQCHVLVSTQAHFELSIYIPTVLYNFVLSLIKIL